LYGKAGCWIGWQRRNISHLQVRHRQSVKRALRQMRSQVTRVLRPDCTQAQRTFGEAISVCFSKYVGFSGRASRSEFWYWILFTILAGIVTSLADAALFGAATEISPISSLF
jgi:hypothetical protein